MTTCKELKSSEDRMSDQKSQSEGNSWHWPDDEDSSTDDDESGTFQITDPKYGKSLARKLHAMQCDDYMCDFTLTAETDGTTFRAHKLLLALSSDFFKRLFVYEPSRTELTLKCDSATLKNIVLFIYTGKIRGNNEDFFEIFRVADCYQIQSFQEEWLKHFENHWVNEKRLIGAFHESQERQMTPISNVCIDYLLKHMSHKTFTDDLLQSMSVDVFADVLAREDVLTADSTGVLPLGQSFEFRLWEHLKRWLELHSGDKQHSLTRLAKSINFSCFTHAQVETVEETCAAHGDVHLPQEVFQQAPDNDAWSNLVSKRRFCKPRCLRTVSQSDYRFVVLKEGDVPPGDSEIQPPELDKVLKRIEFYANSDNAIRGIRQSYETINVKDRAGEAYLVVDVGDTSNGEPFHTVELEENERIVTVRGEMERILVQVVFQTSTGRTIAVPENRSSVVINHKDFLFKTPFYITQSKRLEMYFSILHAIGAKLDSSTGGLVDLRFHWACYKHDLSMSDLCIGGAPETPSQTYSSPFSHDDYSDSDYSMSVDHFMYGDIGDFDFYAQFSD